MTMHVWRILSAVSVGVFILGLILLLALRLLKNGYYHEYTQDELLKKVKAANSKNSIYFTSGETKNFIKKYVICKTLYDKYLVCNYTKSFEDISYFVVQYSRLKRVIGVINVTHRDTGDSSKVIALKKGCASVNVVIGTADGITVNSNVIRPLPMSKVRIHAALKSLVLFTFLFAVRHAAVELFSGVYTLQFLDNFLNYGIIAASFVLALLSYLITALCFRRRNAKIRNGGALEYEFL
ncbi:MAG: hypothetical protein K2O89_01920 [Clostridia bacterium]|nr:hypothetical protein [Clostridia bacterium]